MDLTTLIIGALIGAIFSIPFGIFVNITTPWVVSYFKNRSLSSRQRKAIGIITRYERIKEFRDNPSSLIIYLQKNTLGLIVLSLGLLGVSLMIGETGLGITGFVFAFFLFAPVASSLSKTYTDLENFDKYEQITISRLKKLGYSLDDAIELKIQNLNE